MGLLRTILVILLIYYGFKFLARLFAPYLMKRMVHNMQQKAQSQQRNQQQPNVKVGETIIDKKPNTNNQTNNSVGEYVDYEEVE